MAWADYYIRQLQEGKTVKFRPKGYSMAGIIEHNQLVTVVPIIRKLKIGDVVLCKVGGRTYLHVIKNLLEDKNKSVLTGKEEVTYCIGNNKGNINGWTKLVYGIMI